MSKLHDVQKALLASVVAFAASSALHAKSLQENLALIELPAAMLAACAPEIRATTDTVTCLRSVLMKPEHERWLDPIMEILEAGVRRLA